MTDRIRECRRVELTKYLGFGASRGQGCSTICEVFARPVSRPVMVRRLGSSTTPLALSSRGCIEPGYIRFTEKQDLWNGPVVGEANGPRSEGYLAETK